MKQPGTKPAPPEIAEEDARGTIADLYGDIRAVTQRPVVNLLFRTLAAAPGALDWSWRRIRPAYQTGTLERIGRTLAISSDLFNSASSNLTRSALASAGVDTDALTTIRTIFDHYNASNRSTVVAVMLLQHALDRPVAIEVPASIANEPPTPPYTLPPLLQVDQMATDLRERVVNLSGRLSKGGAVIVPGIYRHLAHWPGFIELMTDVLGPLFDAGAISEQIASVGRQAEAQITELIAAPSIRPSDDKDRLEPDIRDAVSTITAEFRHKVAEMLVIGLLMEATVAADTP